MSLSHSEAFLVSAYPKEYTETFQAAQVAAFSFFGAVPTRTASDNTTIVVRKVIGRERELIREFLRHESYYLSPTGSVGSPGQREGPRRGPGRLRAAQLHGARPFLWPRARSRAYRPRARMPHF